MLTVSLRPPLLNDQPPKATSGKAPAASPFPGKGGKAIKKKSKNAAEFENLFESRPKNFYVGV